MMSLILKRNVDVTPDLSEDLLFVTIFTETDVGQVRSVRPGDVVVALELSPCSDEACRVPGSGSSTAYSSFW
jgi:hypothetical protein